jgi:hypothetical protein
MQGDLVVSGTGKLAQDRWKSMLGLTNLVAGSGQERHAATISEAGRAVNVGLLSCRVVVDDVVFPGGRPEIEKNASPLRGIGSIDVIPGERVVDELRGEAVNVDASAFRQRGVVSDQVGGEDGI